ncbi:MAG: glycosyltransferase family 2 protein [Azoarcus sp.]|jgi:glycosyltransferase involved in cell wall biosynthesis|nr:glycosyltransferase family 2 protein [Azoarcus sp.]
MKTVAVVPVFNHGETVGEVVRGLRAHGLPVILVDDGSDAATARTLDALAAEAAPEAVALLRHPENRGKGVAVMRGFRHAYEGGASHALQVDADGQHDLDAVPAFLSASAQHPAAVVAGCPRYDASVPKGRKYARYLTHVWVGINTLSTRIADSMCGFRLYPLAPTVALLPALTHARRMNFDTEILVQLDWEGVPVVNLPVAVRYPAGGISHFRLWRDNLRISAMHARLFFGMLRRLPRLIGRHFGTSH